MNPRERPAPLERVRTHGREVVEMQVSGPGHDDLVLHTLYHFLRPSEGWEAARPTGAPSPAAGRAALAARGFKPSNSRLQSASWWRERLPLLRELHDLGYYPRYARLVERAGGLEGARTCRWVRARGEGRWLASIDGFHVVVAEAPGEFRVVTAYRSYVIHERDAGPGRYSFGELARAFPVRAEPAVEGTRPSGGRLS